MARTQPRSGWPGSVTDTQPCLEAGIAITMPKLGHLIRRHRLESVLVLVAAWFVLWLLPWTASWSMPGTFDSAGGRLYLRWTGVLTASLLVPCIWFGGRLLFSVPVLGLWLQPFSRWSLVLVSWIARARRRLACFLVPFAGWFVVWLLPWTFDSPGWRQFRRCFAVLATIALLVPYLHIGRRLLFSVSFLHAGSGLTRAGSWEGETAGLAHLAASYLAFLFTLCHCRAHAGTWLTLAILALFWW